MEGQRQILFCTAHSGFSVAEENQQEYSFLASAACALLTCQFAPLCFSFLISSRRLWSGQCSCCCQTEGSQRWFCREWETQQLSCSGASLIVCAKGEWKPAGLVFLFFAAQGSAATWLWPTGNQLKSLLGEVMPLFNFFFFSLPWILDCCLRECFLPPVPGWQAAEEACHSICQSTGGRHQTHQINSVFPKEQLPAKDI